MVIVRETEKVYQMAEPKNLVYIASKLGPMEHEVRALKKILEYRGYTIGYDWTEHPVAKPFADHPKEAHAAASAMAEAVRRCDILIVLCAPNGLGMHIETGGALVSSIILSYITNQVHKQIYIVGEDNDRSVFYFHESVTRVPNIQVLLEVVVKPE
jgi:hypothetical protein